MVGIDWGLEREDKQLPFAAIEKGEPVQGFKERGFVVKTGSGNDLSVSIVHGN